MDGLALASREALAQAELVMGARRHLALLPSLPCPAIEWPVPFTDGIALLLAHRGRRVVMLASGDPFWFGAGTTITKHLSPDEWRAHPAPSAFGRAAARLGWSLERTICLGLHASPLTRIRPHLAPGQRIIVLLRGGAAVAEVAAYLAEHGFHPSEMHVLEALGGPRERIRTGRPAELASLDVIHPVAVGIECAGAGTVIPCASGKPDSLFDHDGQITKRPIRALTLSTLAPCPGELLWDIGAGSGSISIEWLLAHPSNRAMAFEADPVRATRARANADALGVDSLEVVPGRAPDTLPHDIVPNAVFVGGGLSTALMEDLFARLPAGTRLVANAVTLESEALLILAQGQKGGNLLRIELGEVAPLGQRRAWRSTYPVVQWSVVL